MIHDLLNVLQTELSVKCKSFYLLGIGKLLGLDFVCLRALWIGLFLSL